MAKPTIPDKIKQYRLEPCTEIKLIGGYYYVYMYHFFQRPDGVLQTG